MAQFTQETQDGLTDIAVNLEGVKYVWLKWTVPMTVSRHIVTPICNLVTHADLSLVRLRCSGWLL